MVDIIQQIHKTQIQTKGPSTSMDGWNTTQFGMPNATPMDAQKSQEVMNSQGKLITIKEIFLDINKEMLKINYTLNLKKLLKIAPKLNKYLWQKLKLKKTQNISKTTIMKQVGFSIPKVRTAIVVINNHMAIIHVQIGKNTIKGVLLDKGSRVNIITKQLRLRLGLLKPKPTPYNLRMVD